MALEEKPTRKYGVSSADEEQGTSNIFSKLKDPSYRSKFFRWIWLPCAMFTLGIVVAQGGPTLLDLRIITDTDEETGSFFFTSISGGYLLGSFLGGALHGKISNNLIMAAVTILGGATTIATPYCSNLVLMICMRGITGSCMGGIDCSINAEHMKIWGNDGQALLQFVHFSFAIGGVISPLYSAPFLAENEEEEDTKTTPGLYLNVTQATTVAHTVVTNSTLPQTTDVHYAYLISGIILALSSIPFLAMLMCFKKSKTVEEKSEDDSPQRKVLLSVHVFLIAILCAFYITYACVENTFSSFLETFLVKEYKDMSKAQAAYITTYYWAAYAAGRFSSIFTAKWLIAVRVLYLQLTLMVIAFSGFLVSAFYRSIHALTGFTCLVGVALSSIYPAGFSWTESEIMKVTGRISGVILVGSSVGSTLNPFIIGYLMQNKSNLWFCYFLVGSVVVTCLLFLFLLIFNRLHVNKKFGTFDEQRALEKQVNSSAKRPESVF